MHPSIVVARGVTKAFTPDAGVFDLDLEIEESRIVGFIGPSGSGKTTTVRLMAGLMAADSGSMRVFGENPTQFDANTRARLGYMSQEAILYPDLTLGQNLRFSASLYGLSGSKGGRFAELVHMLDLDGKMDRMPEEASGGERRRLMLAEALFHSPELLFLDEPTAGIDPLLRRRIWDSLAEIRDGGATLIITTQYVGEAAHCDYVAVLDQGAVVTYDTPEGLRTTAYGGELIDVVLADRPSPEQVSDLETAVEGELLERIDDTTLRLVVVDAGTAGPRANSWATGAGVELSEVESHVPSFDDVFVRLIDQFADTDQSDQPDSPKGEQLPEISRRDRVG